MGSEQKFLAQIDGHHSDEEIRDVARQLIDWAPHLTGKSIKWGTGTGEGIRGTVAITVAGRSRALLYLRATGAISLIFVQIRDEQGVGENRVRGLKERLNQIRGMNIPIPGTTKIDRDYRNKFPMGRLTDPSDMNLFKNAWAWVLAELEP